MFANQLLQNLGRPVELLAGVVATIGGAWLLTLAATGLGGFLMFFATICLCVATLGLIFPNATPLAMAAVVALREAGVCLVVFLSERQRVRAAR